jgi:hypothetical protein
MSLEQYSWVVAMAAMWGAGIDPINPPNFTEMEFINAVGGTFASPERSAANDSGDGGDKYEALLIYLILRAECAKWYVFSVVRALVCAKLLGTLKIHASHVLPGNPGSSRIECTIFGCAISLVPSHLRTLVASSRQSR